MARKAAGAVQTEEQRSNPLKRKAGKGKKAWSQDLSVTEQNNILSIARACHWPSSKTCSWFMALSGETIHSK